MFNWIHFNLINLMFYALLVPCSFVDINCCVCQSYSCVNQSANFGCSCHMWCFLADHLNIWSHWCCQTSTSYSFLCILFSAKLTIFCCNPWKVDTTIDSGASIIPPPRGKGIKGSLEPGKKIKRYNVTNYHPGFVSCIFVNSV